MNTKRKLYYNQTRVVPEAIVRLKVKLCDIVLLAFLYPPPSLLWSVPWEAGIRDVCELPRIAVTKYQENR